MWPSLPSFSSFSSSACPAGDKCELPHCLFSHNADKSRKAQPAKFTTNFSGGARRESKRPKLDNRTKEPALQASRNTSPSTVQTAFGGSIAHKEPSSSQQNKGSRSGTYAIGKPPAKTPLVKTDLTLPRSATRSVSPPPKPSAAKAAPKPEVNVDLTPRKVPRDPVAWTRRLTMLKMLRQFMAPLNEKVFKSSDANIKALHLNENQLNKAVVDEEEKVAVQHAAVYENVLKQRLVALKKMSLDDWVKSRRESIARESEKTTVKPTEKAPEPVKTGLTPEEEVIFLSRLLSPRTGLDSHGYVTKLPTEEDIEETRRAQYTANFWEICDRCNTRFQVFPERREEDGALTSGGKCTYHWGKLLRPKKAKGALPGPSKWTCCGEAVGSAGCTTHDTHVYKVSAANRLALIMPFIETPENDKIESHTAVCFDCEMGYTTLGLELMRLTAVSWPSHTPILDVLVRPLGHILDVNTRFSGITTEKFFSAKPYDFKDPSIDPKDLRIVESPYEARDLFLSLVSRDTPVIGHALENDLNAIRLVHPSIVDTVFLYPHPAGLPLRYALRNLSKLHLGLAIQQGGAAGHDSFEDAKATGELVRLVIANQWKILKRDGWTIQDDGLYPPIPDGVPPATYTLPAPSMVGASAKPLDEGTKRKFGEYDEEGVEDEGSRKRHEGAKG
ncbi:hypothetical protein CC78DRAFT_554347 [Lojkania enalia]|uniref:Exonuclease domain-containing protein n=1 Tax=Lojkania enalia TaxID=147567 RepID=A0A9P4K649_9PLEO|nr:hypothetical protein CC78DRAFT_554347 [Didymosphaeria enalia]